MIDRPKAPRTADPPHPVREQVARVIPSTQLFGDLREVCIEHDGVRYRLRITRRNKLILQK